MTIQVGAFHLVLLKITFNQMKLFKPIFTLLMLVGAMTQLQAQVQKGSVVGRVLGSKQEALAGVVVKEKGATTSTLTNENGYFELNNLLPKETTIEFVYMGYGTLQKKVTVEANTKTQFVVTLKQVSRELGEVKVKENRLISEIDRLPTIQGTLLVSGKKNEVISVSNLDANIAEKTPRQLFSKVPGVFVYDMDGSGNQVNISTRGLDPHRGWEFNLRKDGIITNSDMYGYPASHYSMPMESIEKIELIRGTGSLQYGAQFGGMLNYVTKSADTSRTFGFESINSVGSFGLLSSYNAIGGKVGKLTYYAYYSKRHSDGYRQNSQSDAEAQSVRLGYQFNRNVALTADFSRSKYVYHIPGPLTDSMFYANPRQATRSRNYFSPDIYIPSLTLDWHLGASTNLQAKVSAVLGSRNSVLFDKLATVVDKIDATTLNYAARQVDIDNFNSYTAELRLLHHYQLFGQTSVMLGGIQLINNDLHRRQLGVGTTGSNFDLNITGNWGRDLHFKTHNIAIFVENSFRLSPRLSVNPGARFEAGESAMSGSISYYNPGDLPATIKHSFPLLGVNFSYQLTQNQQLYGGWSQAYRPVIFKDIIPASTYERVDKNLKDAFGYNLEVGYRGSLDRLKWDVSAFAVQYNNRMGTLSQTDAAGTYIYRTNIGNSLTKGIELFVEAGFRLAPQVRLSVFTSTAYMDGRYQNAQVRVNQENVNVSGNHVESVPEWISRNGVNLKYKRLSASVLYSYTAQSYADALNTVKPSATGAVGLVPAYGLLDFNSTYYVSKSLLIKLNLNNLTDNQYFTKRPMFYPGPGVWASDGRSAVFTVGLKL